MLIFHSERVVSADKAERVCPVVFTAEEALSLLSLDGHIYILEIEYVNKIE